jgi:hypothetical protein
MPEVNNTNLTLTTSDGSVEVRVRYDVTFSPLERQLAALGMEFHSHITAHGIDGDVVGPSIVAVDFPTRTFPVTLGDTELTLPRDESETVPRSALQEDTGGDRDELKAKIYIHSGNFPVERTPDSLTELEVLLG